MLSIRVYYADLSRLCVQACSPLLSATEKRRAAGVSNRNARDEFVKTRTLLRLVLAKHTGQAAAALLFGTGVRGKPVLLGTHGVHFNVSHSDGTALIAVASAEIGIDIERIDECVDYWGVAEAVFSQSEIDVLRDTAEGRRGEAFFSIWTRKEAYLKATGAGFSSDLPKISTMASSPGAIEDHSCTSGHHPWRAFDLPAPAGFKAALVTASSNTAIEIVDVASIADLPMHGEALASIDWEKCVSTGLHRTRSRLTVRCSSHRCKR